MVKMFVFDNLQIGGGKTLGLNYIKHAIKNSPESYYLIPDDADYINLVHDYQIQNNVLVVKDARKLRINIRSIYNLNKYLRKNKIDKVINFTNMPFIILFNIKQYLFLHKAQLLIPLINEFFRYEKLQFIRLFIDKLYLRLNLYFGMTSHILLQTEFMKNYFENNYNFKGRVNVVPSGYNQPDENFEKTTSPYIKSQSLKLFVPTSEGKHKNVEYIFKVANQLKKKAVDIEFHITIPEREKYNNYIKKYKLEKYIIMHGKINTKEIHHYYKNCDALFLPTFLESFCLPYVEAMSYGKYVITSDRPFAREICKEQGFYFNPNNIASGVDVLRDFIMFFHKFDIRQTKIELTKIYTWEESFNLLIDAVNSER